MMLKKLNILNNEKIKNSILLKLMAKNGCRVKTFFERCSKITNVFFLTYEGLEITKRDEPNKRRLYSEWQNIISYDFS